MRQDSPQQARGPAEDRAGLRRFVLSAALCAASLALTWLVGQFGADTVLLPYQLPILLGGYLLPMTWAVGCAVTAPILGTIFLGFPGAIVMLPLVACQMIALAALGNFLYTMLDINPFAVCTLSVAFSYVILFCAAAIYGAVSNGAVEPLSYVRGTLIATWPGVIAEYLAPMIVAVLRRRGRKMAEELSEET